MKKEHLHALSQLNISGSQKPCIEALLLGYGMTCPPLEVAWDMRPPNRVGSVTYARAPENINYPELDLASSNRLCLYKNIPA